MAFDNNVVTLTNLMKDEKFNREIKKLVKNYNWGFEGSNNLSIEDPSCIIRVVTDLPPFTERLYPEIKTFKDELEMILQKYGLEIQEFYDKNKSNDLKYRRLDITLKRRN